MQGDGSGDGGRWFVRSWVRRRAQGRERRWIAGEEVVKARSGENR
jgi:hypothetical protein